MAPCSSQVTAKPNYFRDNYATEDLAFHVCKMSQPKITLFINAVFDTAKTIFNLNVAGRTYDDTLGNEMGPETETVLSSKFRELMWAFPNRGLLIHVFGKQMNKSPFLFVTMT
jgi:hypothetical protein